jgi:hypothetical protein
VWVITSRKPTSGPELFYDVDSQSAWHKRFGQVTFWMTSEVKISPLTYAGAAGCPRSALQEARHLQTAQLNRRVFLQAAVAWSIGWAFPSPEADVYYSLRGDRWEGLRSKIVGGLDIELISAAIFHDENLSSLPDNISLGFFLKKLTPVFITVRELNYKKYYWLDRVSPASPWVAGMNQFRWETAPVLKRVQPLPLVELAFLVRLDKPDASLNEHVAPSVLYSAAKPDKVRDYVFSFRTGEAAEIRWFIERSDGGPTRIASSRTSLRSHGQRAFAIHWQSAEAPPGLYRLVLNGTNESDNKAWTQRVSFYHQPAWS